MVNKQTVAHLGTAAAVNPQGIQGIFTWLSKHSDLVAAAAAFAVIYFLLIRKQ